MPTLLIDNYDSYTFNLFQLLAGVGGEDPVVVRNDEVGWDELAREGWDRIVVSPGPGRPERERDLGICREALAQDEIPVLGVCLGHQGLAHVRGGTVVRGEAIVHGRISPVFHRGEGLFSGLPQGFRAVRYHSLIVEPALPPGLEAIAWADDGTLMGIRARDKRAWGVQFHPESVGTEHGARIVENFLALTPPARRAEGRPSGRGTPAPQRAEGRSSGRVTPAPQRAEGGHCGGVAGATPPAGTGGGAHIVHRVVEAPPDPERAFAALFADREHAFWLDSSLADPTTSRFSFIGAAMGSLGAEVRYRVHDQRITVTRDGRTVQHTEPLLDYLARELARLHTTTPELPFDFNGGFAGYLGYELKADCGATGAHRSALPDAFLLLADRIVAFDHQRDQAHVLALSERPDDEGARRWVEETAAAIADTGQIPTLDDPPTDAHRPPAFGLARGREHHMANVEACKRLLEAGESYEICLTNRIDVPAPHDAFELYRVLRRVNPAPYGAYLRMREATILSSSPERFLRVRRDRSIETKPIKGTARRHHAPERDAASRDALVRSPKDRAEHLMIVDLLRNDLGRVSQVGSIYVAKLMDVESYETVHQLVSTIRGLLRDDVDLADCIRATFPGGSMTGAPKLRTMEIIDDLEGAPRGVYSGALGYLALNGTADLSIVIRTLVATPAGATIGTGGAVVMLSGAEAEYEEMLLKAQPLLDAVSIHEAAGTASAAVRDR